MEVSQPPPRSPAKLNLVALPHDVLLIILRSVDSFKTLLTLLSTSRVFAQLFSTHSTVIIPHLVQRVFSPQAITLLDYFRPGPSGISQIAKDFFAEISQGAFSFDGRPEIGATKGKYGKEEVKWLQWNRGYAEGLVEQLVEEQRVRNMVKVRQLAAMGKGARATQLRYYDPPAEEERARMIRGVYTLVILALQFHSFGIRELPNNGETKVVDAAIKEDDADSGNAPDDDGDVGMDTSDAGDAAPNPPPAATGPTTPEEADEDILSLVDTTPHPQPHAIAFNPPQTASRRRAYPMFYDYTVALHTPVSHLAEALCVTQGLRFSWELALVVCSDASAHSTTASPGAAALRYFIHQRCLDSSKSTDQSFRNGLPTMVEAAFRDAYWNKGRAAVQRLVEAAVHPLNKREYECRMVQTMDGEGNLVKRKMVVLTELGADLLGLNMDEVVAGGEDFDHDEDDDMDDWSEEDDEDDEDEEDDYDDYPMFGGGSMFGDEWEDEDEDEGSNEVLDSDEWESEDSDVLF